MAQNIVAFETEVANRADEFRALMAAIEYFITERWTDANGAGFESTYNALSLGSDVPTGGAITKNQMNNAIAAFNAMKSAWEANRAALHIVADLNLNT